MACRGILFNALMCGEIKGYEKEIAEGLLTCNREELAVFSTKGPYFAKIIASVWREEKVMKHLRDNTTFSFRGFMDILKEVEFTDEEVDGLLTKVSEYGSNIPSKLEAELRATIDGNQAALVNVMTEMWKAVFLRK